MGPDVVGVVSLVGALTVVGVVVVVGVGGGCDIGSSSSEPTDSWPASE